MIFLSLCVSFFFSSALSLTEIYTLSLHDALPIWGRIPSSTKWRVPATFSSPFAPGRGAPSVRKPSTVESWGWIRPTTRRSEEHTSELQSHSDLVCRLLLEKKKNKQYTNTTRIDTD